MPSYEFQFVNRKSKQVDTVQCIDDRMCKWLGVTPDPTKAPYYDAVGTAACNFMELRGYQCLDEDFETGYYVIARAIEHITPTWRSDRSRFHFGRFVITNWSIRGWKSSQVRAPIK